MEQKIHQIIVITPCSYLMQGLVSLIDGASLSLGCVQVNTPEDIPLVPLPTGHRVVLMVHESDAPAETAHQQAAEWRFERMMAMGVVRRTPLLILSSDLQLTIAGKIHQLCVSCLGEQLTLYLGAILAQPEKYLNVTKGICRLSRRQRSILALMLAGKTVQGIADHLRVSPRAVFASRSLLMRKMGGCNRIGLMSLSEQDLGICHDVLSCYRKRAI